MKSTKNVSNVTSHVNYSLVAVCTKKLTEENIGTFVPISMRRFLWLETAIFENLDAGIQIFYSLFFCYGMFTERVYVNDVNAIPIVG